MSNKTQHSLPAVAGRQPAARLVAHVLCVKPIEILIRNSKIRVGNVTCFCPFPASCDYSAIDYSAEFAIREVMADTRTFYMESPIFEHHTVYAQ